LDRLGQVFTIDAMLAILIVTVIIGFSADVMDIAGNKLTEYSSEHSIQIIAECAADILIKTPGTPGRWEEANASNNVTPGLAAIENGTGRVIENTLSMRKVIHLKENPGLMNKIVPLYMNAGLMIYPLDESFPIIAVVNKTPPPDAVEVYVVNRTVLYDYMFMKSIICISPGITGEGRGEYGYICTHSNPENKHKWPDFINRREGWLCKLFSINSDDINVNDYYLITDPPVLSDNRALWIVDNTENISENSQKFTTKPIKLNPIFSELLGDQNNQNNATFTLHVFTSGDQEKLFNTYIIAVPRGTPLEDIKIDYMKPMPAFMILKVWI
jgi:hypothetical protein